MPMAVCTFLEQYDFFGKTIIPFCTHEGSGLGKSESDIEKLCVGARGLKGFPIRGASVQSAEHDIEEWLEKLRQIKDVFIIRIQGKISGMRFRKMYTRNT